MARDELYYEVMHVFQQELNAWKRLIAPLDVLRKMGFVSRDAYVRWKSGDLETLDDGFTVPRSRVADAALCLRTMARAYGFEQVEMQFLSWGDNRKTLRISRASGIRRLLSRCYRVRRKATREQVSNMLDKAKRLADEKRKDYRLASSLEELLERQENTQRRKRYAGYTG